MSSTSDPFDGFDGEDRHEGDEPEGADFQVDKVTQEREKAIEVVLSDTGDLKWIPKSVIHMDSEVFEKPDDGDGGGKLVVHRWFAEQEGLL